MKYPQDEGILESLTAPLFDEPGFDAEAAWHDVVRKSETVESARTAYELAKEYAADSKKMLDTRQKELEDLIKELRWKERRADMAKREPKLVEATDGVEGMGGLSTDDADNPEPDDLGDEPGEWDAAADEELRLAAGEEREGELGASDDAGGDDQKAG